MYLPTSGDRSSRKTGAICKRRKWSVAALLSRRRKREYISPIIRGVFHQYAKIERKYAAHIAYLLFVAFLILPVRGAVRAAWRLSDIFDGRAPPYVDPSPL